MFGFQYRYILSIAFCVSVLSNFVIAQRPQYTMMVDLDTSEHSLTMSMEVRYFNNSDKVLEEIPFHLWANAHANKSTELVKQKLHQGDLSLLKAKAEDLGGFENFNVSAFQQYIKFEVDASNVELGWAQLSKPLSPGDSITLTFASLTLDIPKSFSRLGYTGKSYQLTQWYPHIPVLDENGWNIMPNLDLGEYYNDFADYEVTINVPENYIVGATGKLHRVVEEGSMKQFQYSAQKIIDFAFFASPDFQKESKTITINDRSVEINIYKESYLNDDWDSAMVYAERAVRFYSDWLGTYPYEQITVVHTPFSKAGFMEYPTLAQISFTNHPQLLDRVITHEIGHTWLYGILANNERKHPWMDEGLNSFLENEYMNTFYKKPEEIVFPDIIHSPHSMSDYGAFQHIVRSAGNLQPPAMAPERQQSDQYIFSAYILPSQGLQLMKEDLGVEGMKQMFRDYFRDYKFTHVSPLDLQTSFQKSCHCDLNWFFNSWINNAHEIDYRISKVNFYKDEILLNNNSSVLVPVLLSEYKDNALIKKQWINGFEGEQKFSLDKNTNEVRLYEGIMSVNNSLSQNISPRNIFPVISLIPKIGNYKSPTMAITPVVGYNITDGGLAGIAITTDLFPQPKIKLLAMPFYGIESKKFRHFAELRYTSDITIKGFNKFLIGINSSNFAYHLDTVDFSRDQYAKFSPFAGIRFNEKPFSHTTRWLKYRYVNVTRFFDIDKRSAYDVHELSFQINSDTVVRPYMATASVQAGKGFLRAHLHYNQHFRGRDKLRGLWIHGFIGWLPVYKDPIANVRFGLNGKPSLEHLAKDYMYDHWLVGRNATEGNVSRQLFMRDADLKTLADLEETSKWMAGGGFSVSLPLKFIHVYADAGIYNSTITDKLKLNYSSGFSIILMKDAFEIYFPILESKDIRESITYETRTKFIDRISFRANFNLANPLQLIDHYQFEY